MTRDIVRFLAMAVLASCAQQPAAPPAPLAGYWRAVEIEGVPYLPPAGVREAHLMFSGERVSGFTGCNSLRGGFDRDGERLRFKPLAMTRMACLPANDLETRFVSAVNATASARVSGNRLELLDGAGKVRMRLETRDPK